MLLGGEEAGGATEFVGWVVDVGVRVTRIT